MVDVAGKEHLSIIVRFVDDKTPFVDFVTVDRITGEVLAAKLNPFTVKFLQQF